jgi:hypothetical protein
MTALRPPVDLAEVDPVMGPVPALGEHTDAILRELGRTDGAVAALCNRAVVRLSRSDSGRNIREEPMSVLSTEERAYFRNAPLMIVGEGTNDIRCNVIAAQLVKRGGLWTA